MNRDEVVHLEAARLPALERIACDTTRRSGRYSSNLNFLMEESLMSKLKSLGSQDHKAGWLKLVGGYLVPKPTGVLKRSNLKFTVGQPIPTLV